MTKTFLTIGLIAALAACSSEDHNIVAETVPDDGFNAAEAGNFVLPAAIKASKTYRCGDIGVVHVDWLQDGKSATVTPEKKSPIAVASAEPGQPMTAADGTTLTGSLEGGSVKLALAGKGAQSCRG